MSDEWEVVSKQKKPRKPGADKNKAAASNAGIPKIEDAGKRGRGVGWGRREPIRVA